MGIFQITLILAAFLCSLVGGFLFSFAIVVMPGIRSLNDREFIRAFQVMDRIIQNNQPIFMITCIGSIIILIISAVLSIGELYGLEMILMIIAVLFYLAGVQVPTGTINVPLNNKLQILDVNTMDDAERQIARQHFEKRWVRWNLIRTTFSNLTALLLIILLVLQ